MEYEYIAIEYIGGVCRAPDKHIIIDLISGCGISIIIHSVIHVNENTILSIEIRMFGHYLITVVQQ